MNMQLIKILKSGRISAAAIKDRSDIWAIGSQCVTSVANLAVVVGISVTSSIETVGAYGLVLTLLMICRSYMYCIGLTSISALAGKPSARTRDQFVKHSLQRGTIIAALITLTAAALAQLIVLLSNSAFLFGGASTLLATFFLCAFELNRRLILVFQSARYSFFCEAARALIQILYLWIVFIREDSVSITSAELSITLSYFVGWAISTTLLRKYLSIELRPTNIKVFSRWHRPYSTWGLGQVTLENVAGNAPLLIGVSFAGLDGAGLIRIAQSVSNVLNIPVTGIQQIALAKSSLLAKSHGNQAAEFYYRNVSKLLALLLLISSAVLVPASSYIVAVNYGIPMGEQMLMICACYCLIAAIAAHRIRYGIKLNLSRKVERLTASMAFGAVTSVVLSVLLPPTWGALGIATASVATSVVLLLVQRKLARKTPALH